MLPRITAYKKAVEVVMRVADRFKVRRKECVRLDEALGRISAEDLHAPIDIPPFDRATMDGYAVVASDTFYADEYAPVELSLIGEVRAGMRVDRGTCVARVDRGTCVAISTGAPIPEGADAVVKVENAEVSDGKVSIFKSVAPAENVQRAGSDIKRGDRIISEGMLLTPRRTGVLAACGISEVIVMGRPRVAIISTGDELIDPMSWHDDACLSSEALEQAGRESRNSGILPEGKIYDVNMRTLSDAVRMCECVPIPLGIACDDADDVMKKLGEAARKDADVIIVSGSTSAGATDIVPKLIREHGELLVHGVDMKPGKPFAFGIFGGKPIFALPGNPTSALLSFSIFVAPLLSRISDVARCRGIVASPSDKVLKARTTMRIISEKGMNEFIFVRLRARLSANKEEMLAEPILKGSGAITTLADADGYIFVERGREIIEEGEEVEVFMM